MKYDVIRPNRADVYVVAPVIDRPDLYGRNEVLFMFEVDSYGWL